MARKISKYTAFVNDSEHIHTVCVYIQGDQKRIFFHGNKQIQKVYKINDNYFQIDGLENTLAQLIRSNFF